MLQRLLGARVKLSESASSMGKSNSTTLAIVRWDDHDLNL
jgi:hypothetical protein